QAATLPVATLLGYEHPAEITVEYARRLATKMPDGLGRIRLGHTGTQAVETAVLVSRWARIQEGNPERMTILAHHTGYHGTGPGASALIGWEPWHTATGPLLPQVAHTEAVGSMFEDFEAAIAKAGPETISALFIKGVTGKHSIAPTDEDLRALAELCDREGIHLVVDEVISGMGRVGTYTVCEAAGITPTMITLSKGITCGYQPLGAVAISEELFQRVALGEKEFPLASTTDGHPIGVAAGLAVLDAIDEEGILDNVAKQSPRFLEHLGQIHDEFMGGPGPDARGLAVVLPLHDKDGNPWPDEEIEALRLAADADGLLFTGGEGSAHVWFFPPLIITDDEIDEVAERLRTAFLKVSKTTA
ncbi:MAG: aminotransferase class III-fold pyridoxal phosphate-dependent enzyme, partial [Actinobacteria bacterium]|nr:aminotransferase class III-fold pyridoxal phosphate-dependent enzyme [Actinomycetota bacterium]